MEDGQLMCEAHSNYRTNEEELRAVGVVIGRLKGVRDARWEVPEIACVLLRSVENHAREKEQE